MKRLIVLASFICIFLLAGSCIKGSKHTADRTRDAGCKPDAIEAGRDIDGGGSDLFQGDSWAGRVSLPTPRSGAAAAVVDDKIYVIGGYSADEIFAVNECYDPEADTWTARSPMPEPRSGAFAAVVDGKIYVIGGVNHALCASSLNEKYDPKTNTWTAMASMPTSRAVPLAAAVDGRIYVMGGVGGNRISVTGSAALFDVVYAANEVYDPSTDTWIEKASMPSPRWRPAGAVVNGHIHVVGGWEHDGITNIHEKYDPKTDLWQMQAAMPTHRTAAAASAVGNKIYVIGGYSLKDDSKPISRENMHLLAINEEYDAVSEMWTVRRPMEKGRAGSISGMISGRIHVIGGAVINSSSGVLTYSDLNEVYIPH